jgi:hypothetical protein
VILRMQILVAHVEKCTCVENRTFVVPDLPAS